MRKFILSAFMAILSLGAAFAQITEGHVKYKVDVASDDPEMAMAVSMMQGTTLELFFKDKKSRADISMGALMTMKTITDAESEKVLLLMSGMMGNKAVTGTFADLEDEEEKKPEYDVKLTDETKDIAGYTCKKGTMTDEEGNELEFWYTEEVKFESRGQSMMNDQIPGFPMEFAANQNGMVMTFTVETFNKELSGTVEEVFGMAIPDGYEEMTFDDLKQMGM